MRTAALGWGLAIALIPARDGVGSPPVRDLGHARRRVRDRITPQRAVVPDVSSVGAVMARVPEATPTARLVAHTAERAQCRGLLEPDDDQRFISRADATTSFVDGDDLLAIVNRSPTGALAPGWAPHDLVDLGTHRPSTAARCEPPGGQCLRAEAAVALGSLLDAMRRDGVPGHVHSAFRAYASQCEVFDKWAHRDGQGFCAAAEQSALAGHSQHQLGTTLDLFTREWAEAGPVFRSGFGCSRGGRWLAEHAWEHGFVLPYPIHPDRRAASSCGERPDALHAIDPRTGYRAEPWHLRYIGLENSRRFHEDQVTSGVGTGGEITLEQWLRRRDGRAGDAELPVCDGCSCGQCATLARDADASPCASGALRLGDDGAPRGSDVVPAVLDAVAERRGDRVTVRVDLRVDADSVTQSPSPDAALAYDAPNATFESVVTTEHGTAHRFDELPGAWRLAIDTDPASGAWPVRVGLGAAEAAPVWNGANVYLPAALGPRSVAIRLRVPTSIHAVRVAMLRDGVAYDARTVELTP